MLTSVRCELLGILIILVIIGGIQGHPRKRLGNQPSIDNAGTTQEAARKVTESDGKIIFPTDYPLISTVPPPSTPLSIASCGNSTYCEDPPSYPQNFIKNALKARQDLRLLSSIEEVVDIGERIDADKDEESLCTSMEDTVFPKLGVNKARKLKYIVNEVDFPQGVKVEKCMSENTVCNRIEGFADGWKSFCKQKYVYKSLAAVDLNVTGIDVDLFRFPSTCCCYIKPSGNPLLRFGGDSNKAQSPATKTTRQSVES